MGGSTRISVVDVSISIMFPLSVLSTLDIPQRVSRLTLRLQVTKPLVN